MNNFWQKLQRPFFALAPMADVTDPAYRRLISEIAPADVTWTEFVSADGLFHTRTPKKDGTLVYPHDAENPLMRDLTYSQKERPIVAQLFGSNPQNMEYASALARELGFDGIDINMGCPDSSIEKQGAGAAHMKNPVRAREIIQAALKGADDKIPVSVKTRMGYHKISYQEWLGEIIEEPISALTVHLRTRKEMSKVPAHWELAGDISVFVRARRPELTLLGNGDVKSIKEGREKAFAYGYDGIMLGRAIFGNPWLFEKSEREISPTEKIKTLMTLAHYFRELSPKKSFHILKKHFKAFISGWEGAAALRAAALETNDYEALDALLSQALLKC